MEFSCASSLGASYRLAVNRTPRFAMERQVWRGLRSFPRRPLLGALSARGGHRRLSIVRPVWGGPSTCRIPRGSQAVPHEPTEPK
jgi:hypothetical protein